MKAHMPLLYMGALLETTAGTPKEKEYIKEAQRLGIKLLAPDVNKSGILWKLDKQGIRKGLLSIDGIGMTAATNIVEKAPFTDFDDMISRVPARTLTGASLYKKDGTLKGTAQKLRRSGALRSFGVGRFS